MAATPTGNGYWLVASDGGVFSFGDAAFHGSTGSIKLNRPIVAMAATPTGAGYWFVASDGGIFAFGDAGFFGSAGGTLGSRAIAAMGAAPASNGYWLVASDGGVIPEGAAGSFGSLSGTPLTSPIVTFAVTPGGRGYWLGAVDGGLFGYGSVTRPVSASSAVDGSGQYRIGVPAGQYVVVVAATVDGRSLRAQTSVTVSDGASSDVSARLNSSRTGFDFGPFATISGSVADATTHAALGGICVSLYSTAGGRTGDAQACTNAQGTYTMAVASAGSYDVVFAGGAGYVTQWYSGQASQGTANAVVVHTGGDTGNVNAAMVPAGPPPPVVGGVSPSSGPVAGGQTVTITGTHLSGATAVSFGGVAGSVVADGSTQITVTSPARAAGPVDITVTTAGGTSAVGAQDGYTYLAPPATITAVGSAVMDTTQPSGPQDTVAVSPAAPGNLLAMAIETKFPGSPSFTASSVTGGGVTTWHRAFSYLTADGFHGQELWWGVVTAAGPTSITVNYTSGAATGAATSVDVAEFHSASGASTVWSLDVTGKVDTNTSSSTLSYPTLTPGSGPELYFGYLAVPGTLSAGSTPGVTYQTDLRGNQVADDPSVSSSITPTAVSQDTPPTTTFASIGLLMRAV
jgi:IPT/TIG domain